MKLLIIRPGALGDTLLMLPALWKLAGKADIHFAGRQPGLAHMSGAVCQTMDLETAGWHRLFSDQSPLTGPSPLPVSSADKVIAFFRDDDGLIKKNLEAFFPGAAVWVFPSFPPRGENIHVARYLAACLESASLPISGHEVMDNAGRHPLISVPRASGNRNRVVFHPGSGDPEKNHPPDFWLDISKTCMEMDRFAPLKPTVLLGPAETALQSFFNNHNNPDHPLEIITLPEKEPLRRLLGSAVFYMGHDSGITHLSGLMGTPTLALFKKTDPVQWGPLGPNVRIIHGKKPDRKLIDLIMTAMNQMVSVSGFRIFPLP